MFDSLGHINVVVPDLDEATAFYGKFFGATLEQTFPHFRNDGFARSAGFLDDPDAVEVSIRFLKIPLAKFEGGLFLELFQFHNPPGLQTVVFRHTNDMGGPRHICLRVSDIDAVFERAKSTPGTRLINDAPGYRPTLISPITPDQVVLPGPGDQQEAKESICAIVKHIRFFYALDPYGIQWEFEQGHAGIG